MLLVIAVASCHPGLEDRQEHQDRQDRQDLENLQDHQDRQDIKWVDNREWYHEDFAGRGCSKFTGTKKSCCRVNQNWVYRYHKKNTGNGNVVMELRAARNVANGARAQKVYHFP